MDCSIWSEARNQPFQGGAASILKRAMVDAQSEILKRGHDAFLVNQVHDEIIIECKQEEAQEVNSYIKPILENAGSKFLKVVPCKVEGGIKAFWSKE